MEWVAITGWVWDQKISWAFWNPKPCLNKIRNFFIIFRKNKTNF